LIQSGNRDSEALQVCKNWIQNAAENKTRNWKEEIFENGIEAAEVASEYTHYTHKTQGKNIVFNSTP